MMERKEACIYLIVVTFFFSLLSVICGVAEETPGQKLGKDNLINAALPTTNYDAYEENADDELKVEDNVLILTNKNFDGIVDKNGTIVLVLFYSSMKEGFENITTEVGKAAAVLKSNDPPVLVGKVDVVSEGELMYKFVFGSEKFPLLKLFRRGIQEEYNGPENASGIISYITEIVDPNYKPPSAIITLTNENFTQVVNETKVILIEFHTPSCDRCQNLRDELEKVALELSPENVVKSVSIATVDASVETDLAEYFEVEEYPTFKLFRKGEASDYTGPLDSDGMVKHLLRYTREPPPLYSTLAEVQKFINLNLNLVVLGVFDDENDPMYHLFNEAYENPENAVVTGHTFSKEVKNMFDLKSGSAIAIIHPEYLISEYENRFQFYQNSSGNISSLRDFYKKHQVPLVGHLEKDVEDMFSKRPLVVVYYSVSFEPDMISLTKYWWEKIVRVARNYPEMQFAIANEESFSDRMEDLGLGDTPEDINVGLYDENNRRYAMVGENFGEDSLTEFIEEYKAGQLTHVVKSQPPPAKAKRGSVQMVVASTFKDVVLDETKEVFIQLYDAQCLVSQGVAPTIVKLAEHFKNEKDIIIAKIDATENDIPPAYKVPGFPTTYYAKPGKKAEPILLLGMQDLKSLIKFITDNSDILQKKKLKTVKKQKKQKKKDEL